MLPSAPMLTLSTGKRPATARDARAISSINRGRASSGSSWISLTPTNPGTSNSQGHNRLFINLKCETDKNPIGRESAARRSCSLKPELSSIGGLFLSGGSIDGTIVLTMVPFHCPVATQENVYKMPGPSVMALLRPDHGIPYPGAGMPVGTAPSRPGLGGPPSATHGAGVSIGDLVFRLYVSSSLEPARSSVKRHLRGAAEPGDDGRRYINRGERARPGTRTRVKGTHWRREYVDA